MYFVTSVRSPYCLLCRTLRKTGSLTAKLACGCLRCWRRAARPVAAITFRSAILPTRRRMPRPSQKHGVPIGDRPCSRRNCSAQFITPLPRRRHAPSGCDQWVSQAILQSSHPASVIGSGIHASPIRRRSHSHRTASAFASNLILRIRIDSPTRSAGEFRGHPASCIAHKPCRTFHFVLGELEMTRITRVPFRELLAILWLIWADWWCWPSAAATTRSPMSRADRSS